MIQYKIITLDEAIAFQVQSQDSSVKEFLAKAGGTFHASNGWAITTSKVPELNVAAKTICLRGTDNSADFRVDRTWGLESNWQRDRIVDQATEALSELQWSMKNNRELTYIVVAARPTSKLESTEGRNTKLLPTIEG